MSQIVRHKCAGTLEMGSSTTAEGWFKGTDRCARQIGQSCGPDAALPDPSQAGISVAGPATAGSGCKPREPKTVSTLASASASSVNRTFLKAWSISNAEPPTLRLYSEKTPCAVVAASEAPVGAA